MIKFKKLLSLTVFFSLIITLTACNNNKSAINQDGVVATVNDKPITQKELDENLAIYSKINPAWTEEKMLDQLILEVLLVEKAEKEGITVSDEDVNAELENIKIYTNTEEEYQKFLKDNGMTEEYLKESLRKEFLINHYISIQMEKINPSDEELQKMFDEYKMKEEVRASHILVKTLDEAKAVTERLNKGDKFEDVAKELSIDTGSGAMGGDLGYFSFIKMVKPFSEAAFNMEIGQVSEPVQSEFGYHIIKLTDKKKDESKTLETEKPILQEYYTYIKYDELLENIKKEAEIIKK